MPRYNLQWLRNTITDGKDAEFLFFWGHTNHDNSQVGKFLLSQWYPLPFSVSNQIYPTAEHWMMAEKARLFGDADILQKTLAAITPKEAKQWGREVQNFNPELWEQKRFDIVVQGNFQKFSQNKPAKNYLLATGHKIIVEASPVDAIWGMGHTMESAESKDPFKWRGQNLLGFALMEVRDLLQATTL
jgi:ribA/ribD-fused uncharacterized protein